MQEILFYFNLEHSALGLLTSSVQFGFITGTLVFAMLSFADRYAPSKVFFICALLGALFNFSILGQWNSLYTLMLFRMLTGFFLAGIYPVGMKIAADYFDKDLSKSLGFLVGALVLGTAFPHLAKGITSDYPWQYVIMFTSFLAILGGVLIYNIPNGPYRKKRVGVQLTACWKAFKNPLFRIAAFGYFGHMWELYAFWTFVPVICAQYLLHNGAMDLSVSILSFCIMGIGGLGCIVCGYLCQFYGAKKVAYFMLFCSGMCCVLSPFVLDNGSTIFSIGFLLFWGFVVVGDSPLFSTLVAQHADPDIKGSALTIVTCVGFAITILSIQLLSFLYTTFHSKWIFMILALGPFLSLSTYIKNRKFHHHLS